MQLEATRAVDLAQAVTALCQLGARPRPALLSRLLAFGPLPDYSMALLRDLLAAVNGLLGADGADNAGNTLPAARPALSDAPGEGAGPREFDAFVDAARRELGASDAELAPAAAAPEDGASAAGLRPGAGLLWQLAGMEAAGGGADSTEADERAEE
jgi:hypothetical protein